MRQNKTKKLSYLPSKHFITICPFITLSIIKYFITFNCYLFPYSVRIRHFAMKEFCNMVSFFSSSPYSMFDFFFIFVSPDRTRDIITPAMSSSYCEDKAMF